MVNCCLAFLKGPASRTVLLQKMPLRGRTVEDAGPYIGISLIV